MLQDERRPPQSTAHSEPPDWSRFWDRHFWLAAAGVLLLAAMNVGVRLDQEVVTDWDEGLYAITAWESLQSGHWIGTTFLGQIDYYNSKPPLNAWLIALAFKTLGPSLLALRLVSAVSAWATVLVLILWSRRRFGAPIALLAGLVLSTSFGFMYVHSGRSGNADSLFTLLVLLLVITLCAERSRPWLRVWLGPAAAGLFLLKGMAVLMPLVIVAGVLAVRPSPSRGTRLPSLVALLLFVVPCAAWAAARWSVDGITFFHSMWRNDLIRISTEVLDGHSGTPFFYLHVLQKNHYEWLIAAAAAFALVPAVRSGLRRLDPRRMSDTTIVLVVWGVVCLLIPTAMRTKLPWYLNPFYPVFALGMGWTLARGLAQYGSLAPVRKWVLVTTIVVAAGVGEARLVWYSFQFRDVDRSVQGLLMAESSRMARTRIYREEWSHSDLFVLQAIVGADGDVARGAEDFLLKSRPGDFFVAPPGLDHPSLSHVRSIGSHALYERTMSVGLSVGGGAEGRAPLAASAPDPSDRADRGS